MDGKFGHREKCKLFFQLYWKFFVIVIVPIIFLPIMGLNNWTELEYRCLYVVCVMAIYWVTEALPLAITSMIPIVAFPLMNILPVNTTCVLYMQETIVMFVGGLIIALAVEYCNLHKRVALRTIQIVGCSTARLSFSLVFVTMFISFWISNTAAAAMMCPIVEAVLQELENEGACKMFDISTHLDGTEKKRPTNITRCFFLGTAYGSTIGGIGTLIGSGTNLTFKGMFEARFPEAGPITFLDWMLFNSPLAVINTFLTWIWLQFVFMGLWRPESSDAKESTLTSEGEAAARKIIDQRYDEIGPISAHEISVLILFILAVVLFVTREPGFMTGWGSFFSSGVKDAVPAIFIVLLLFILPSNYDFMKFFWTNEESALPHTKTNKLITWQFIQAKLPWGLVFLLGAGFAIAEGGRQSGMSQLLGEKLSGIQELPNMIILLLACLTASVLTEFSANVPICNIILPILAEMATTIKINPIYLMLPAAVCCSFAFHTPVGTPPNAIVSGFANINSWDFALGGIGPSFITLITIWLGFPTWGAIIYPDSGTFPKWAERTYEPQLPIDSVLPEG